MDKQKNTVSPHDSIKSTRATLSNISHISYGKNNIASAQKSRNSPLTILPNIAQLTGSKNEDEIPMTLDTFVRRGLDELNTTIDTPDWKNLYLNSERLITKLRSAHQNERDGLIKGNLDLYRCNKLLQVAFSQSRVNLSKVLSDERTLSQNKIEALNNQVLGLQRTISGYKTLVNHEKSHSMKLTMQLSNASVQLSKAVKTNTELEHLAKEIAILKVDIRGKTTKQIEVITALKAQRSDLRYEVAKKCEEASALRNELSKGYEEAISMDHVLKVYGEVVESIMKRKMEWSKPPQERDSSIIKKGNMIALGGTCLIDAYRIMITFNKDLAWFIEYYGTTPDTVIKFETSDAFRKLLDMRFEVYRCRDDIRISTAGFEEGFQTLIAAILADPSSTAESIQKFLAGDENTNSGRIYQNLCSLWNAAIAVVRLQETSSEEQRVM